MNYELRTLTPLLPDHCEMNNCLCCFCHIFCTYPFQFAVDILHSGKDIGTRHADITKAASVGTATDAFFLYLQAGPLYGFLGIAHYMRMFIQYLFHVAVLFLDCIPQ